MEGKLQFNGNLALFRVCAITLIVNLVGLVAGLLFSVGQDRFFSLRCGMLLRLRH